MAMSAGLDISDTSKFVAAITDEDWAHQKSIIQSFNEDTGAGIASLVAVGLAAGLSSNEIRSQLSSFTSAQSYRVKRFAQNEAWRASEIAGNRSMLQLSNELNRNQSAGVYKTWKIQSTACAICIDYAEVTIGISELFFGGLNEPPAHVMCRCKLTWSIKKGDPKAIYEIHCAACDRFLGNTCREVMEEKLKCSNSKCRTLGEPTIRRNDG